MVEVIHNVMIKMWNRSKHPGGCDILPAVRNGLLDAAFHMRGIRWVLVLAVLHQKSGVSHTNLVGKVLLKVVLERLETRMDFAQGWNVGPVSTVKAVEKL